MKKLFGKIKCNNKTVFYCFFIPVLKLKIKDAKKNYYFLGVKVFSYTPKLKHEPFNIPFSQNMDVYFDHNCGGGTEVYFFNQLKELTPEKTVLRIQEFNNLYKLSIFSHNNVFEVFFDWKNMRKILSKINNSRFIINNLVGYNKRVDLLNLIALLKQQNNRIVALGHDYFSICPSWNLINYTGTFCKVPNKAECQQCGNKNKNTFDKYGVNMKNIHSWRKSWGDFYKNTVDEFIVFSESSKAIFLKAYPFLSDKIAIVPHNVKAFVRQLSATRKTERPDIVNIATIGTLAFIKGEQLILEMAELIKEPPYENVKLTVIGENLSQTETSLNYTGRYDRDELPRLLEENNIDIVFIASICPETFSYTTTEAMMLGLPVACFDLGAPAERVVNYDKGLVISRVCPKVALDEIINYVKKICSKDGSS